MDLQSGQLPSLWMISARIANALASPKIVVVSFPNQGLADSWSKVLLPALHAQLLIQEDMDEAAELIIDKSMPEPLNQVAEVLEQPLDDLDSFLDVYPGDSILILNWPMGIGIPPSWRLFLADVVSKLKRSDHSRHFRKIIIINAGNQDIPPALAQSPSVDHFQLWNALTWEEFRMFAGSMVADESNEIRKAWMVSSYCGASNFDLEILQNLIRLRPLSLNETVKTALELTSTTERESSVGLSLPDRNFGNEWHPPAALTNAWQDGSVIGASIERGLIRPWQSLSIESRKAVAFQLIWQEQVSGLFPLLIQLGHELNSVVLSQHQQQLEISEGELLEPREMLERVKQSNVWISNVLFEALKKLNKARNQLAHLEPIERRDLEAIWDIQLRVRGGQY